MSRVDDPSAPMPVATVSDRPPIRIALVGCGRIAKNHFETIERVDGLELAAVCDSVIERAREAGERYSVPFFRSLEEMIAKTVCDAVAICTPSGMHPEQGVVAAPFGLQRVEPLDEIELPALGSKSALRDER